jgi:hypothetical protein
VHTNFSAIAFYPTSIEVKNYIIEKIIVKHKVRI